MSELSVKDGIKRQVIVNQLSEIDLKIKSSKERQKKISSDWGYWGHVQQQEKLSNEKRELERELRYLDIKETLNDYLLDDDVVQRDFKSKLIRILDHHKELTNSRSRVCIDCYELNLREVDS